MNTTVLCWFVILFAKWMGNTGIDALVRTLSVPKVAFVAVLSALSTVGSPANVCFVSYYIEGFCWCIGFVWMHFTCNT